MGLMPEEPLRYVLHCLAGEANAVSNTNTNQYIKAVR